MQSPIILEKSSQRLMGLDLASKLMQDRIVIIDEEITDYFSSQIITQLIYLKHNTDLKNPLPITIIIKSPGGSVYDGLGIYDMIENLKSSGIIIKTRGIGMCASMGSFLLSSGSPGERKVYPNTTIMIHQPSGGVSGQISDIEIMANEGKYLKDLLFNLYIKHGANPIIKELGDRDTWLRPNKAIELGLIDDIL